MLWSIWVLRRLGGPPYLASQPQWPPTIKRTDGKRGSMAISNLCSFCLGLVLPCVTGRGMEQEAEPFSGQNLWLRFWCFCLKGSPIPNLMCWNTIVVWNWHAGFHVPHEQNWGASKDPTVGMKNPAWQMCNINNYLSTDMLWAPHRFLFQNQRPWLEQNNHYWSC